MAPILGREGKGKPILGHLPRGWGGDGADGADGPVPGT